MTLTKKDLFELTTPERMFTPDSITTSTSWKGVESIVYSKKIGNSTYSAGSLERLEEMVKGHREENLDSMYAFMKSINL